MLPQSKPYSKSSPTPQKKTYTFLIYNCKIIEKQIKIQIIVFAITKCGYPYIVQKQNACHQRIAPYTQKLD